MFEALHLAKAYRLHGKTLPILRDVSLSVQTGETLAIVGRSGAGKSTLLHVLGGLDRPDSGEVIVDNQSIYQLSSRQRTQIRARRLGFIFQAYHLLPEMNITENVMLPAMAAGQRSHREMAQRAKLLLTRVGLSHRLLHRPQELSGGEQQRAAIARALMNEPPVILADEPTGNLDQTTGAEVLDLLFSLAKDCGTILIMVTHNPDTASRCHNTLTLSDGILV